MQRIIMLFAILPVLAYASYNPFFTPHTKPVAKPTVVMKQVKQEKAEKIDVQFTYFAYLESKKGKFALIKFNGRNIVVRQNNSVYLDNKVYKVQTITSNYLRLSDSYNEMKTVYFSTSRGGK